MNSFGRGVANMTHINRQAISGLPRGYLTVLETTFPSASRSGSTSTWPI